MSYGANVCRPTYTSRSDESGQFYCDDVTVTEYELMF